MNKIFDLMLITGLLLVIAPSSAVAEPCNSLAEIDWILGDWVSKKGEKIILEQWHRVSQNTFEGTGETRSRDRTRLLGGESLRLVEMSGSIFYLAKVTENKYPGAFKLSLCSNERLVFGNPDHDFPKRLIYTRIAADTMIVDVKGDHDEGFQITFRRESEK